MKWFKHMSTSSDDDKISELEDEFGLEGYAVFFKTLEMIARDFDDDEPSVRYSKQKLKRKLGISTQKLTKIYEFLSRIQLLSVKKDGDFLTLESNNMAKFRDNWSSRPKKRSVVATKKVSLEEEVEVEQKKKEKYISSFEKHWDHVRKIAPAGRSVKAKSRATWDRCERKHSSSDIIGAYEFKAAQASEQQFIPGFQVFANPDNVQDWIDQGRPGSTPEQSSAVEMTPEQIAKQEAETKRKIAELKKQNQQPMSLKI